MMLMWNTMKIFIVFAVTLSVARADSVQQSATESTSKAEPKNANTIPVVPQKPQTYYTQVPQRNPYVTYLQKPYYMPQPQAAQPTMLIIAQPALIPQQMIFNQAAQQLLHYFQNNPQARYQFLQGTFQPHQLQHQASYVQPQYYQAPAAQYYQQPQVIAAPQHLAFAHSPFQALPSNYLSQTQIQPHAQLPQTHLTQAQLSQAQLPQAQLPQTANFAQAPIKTAPPIITGFENFTPEQQAQIKEQLSSHFGTSLTHLSGNSLQVPQTATQQFGNKVSQGEVGQQAAESKDAQSQQAGSNYYRNQFAKQQ